jgi:hypothetical protein
MPRVGDNISQNCGTGQAIQTANTYDFSQCPTLKAYLNEVFKIKKITVKLIIS